MCAGPLLHPLGLWAHKRVQREQLLRQPRYGVMRWQSQLCHRSPAVEGASPQLDPISAPLRCPAHARAGGCHEQLSVCSSYLVKCR